VTGFPFAEALGQLNFRKGHEETTASRSQVEDVEQRLFGPSEPDAILERLEAAKERR